MKTPSYKRRSFIKAGLAIPLLGNLPLKSAFAHNSMPGLLSVPKNIHDELIKLYGDQANNIVGSYKLHILAPDIAEDGSVVPVSVVGDHGFITSAAIFVAANKKPLASTFKLHEGADLKVALRVKLDKTSDVYVVGQTKNGLVGINKTIKVTIGCGGF